MGPADFLAGTSAVRRSDEPALVTPEGTMTWAELDAAVSERGVALQAEGAHPQAIHPVVVESDRHGILTILALWRLGVTPAPLNARLTRPERKAAVDALASEQPGAQVILWTSGTSGAARGVALSAQSIRASTEAVAARLGLDGSEWWLCSLSPAHVGGLVLVARALLTGAVLVVPGRFDVQDAVRLLGLEGRPGWLPRPVTHASLVPTQLDRIMQVGGGARADGRSLRGAPASGGSAGPEGLRCVLVGGAHAPLDLVRRATGEGWPIALTYGMTETASQVATASPERARTKPEAVGPPLDGTEVRIAADGEILVRGRTLASGYVGPGAPPLTDGDGWYHTGDLGQLDPEGDLWITGRRSDRIVSGGVTVDALEVEEALRAHPAVVDVCVVGVPSRDWGETVAAVVVPVWGQFEIPEVERFLRQRLSAAKRPRVWKLQGDLPRNANGKVDRGTVRRLVDPV